jgi:hypothetical protein
MRRLATATIAGLLMASSQWAQDRAPIRQQRPTEPQEISTSSQNQLVTIPAGTRIPLSLIIRVQTKLAHRGDLVYLETQYPVVIGTEIAIPAQTYVEGVIEKVDKRGPTAHGNGLQMHFTRLVFSNGYEIRLDNAVVQANSKVPATLAVNMSRPVAFLDLAESNQWRLGAMSFQQPAKAPKPPQGPKPPHPPKGPDPTPTPTPIPTPPPTPPPAPTPTPPPTPTPTPPPTPTPTPPPAPAPTPTPSPTLSTPGSSMGTALGVGVGVLAAAVGGILMARQHGADAVIEEGTIFYMVLQTSLSLERQRVVSAMP